MYFHSRSCLFDTGSCLAHYWQIMLLDTFFNKFHMVFIFQPPKNRWQTSVQTWSILFDLLPFWIASKNISHFGRPTYLYQKYFSKSTEIIEKSFKLYWTFFAHSAAARMGQKNTPTAPLQKKIRPLSATSILDMTLNNLMVTFP